MEDRDPAGTRRSGEGSRSGSRRVASLNGNGDHSQRVYASTRPNVNTNDDLGDGGNIDSYLDADDDEEGWHSADMVAGFSPTSPGAAGLVASRLPQHTGPDLLAGDLDWEAWETPRGPTPTIGQGGPGAAQDGFHSAFQGLNIGKNAQNASSAGIQRRPSPPIIDLRETERQLEARRRGQHSAGNAVASSSQHDMLDAADLSFFEAFDNAPQDVMDQSSNALRDRNKLRGEQLYAMTDAQESPMDLRTPLPADASDSRSQQDYFGEEPSTSPVNIGSSDAIAPPLKRGEGHRGSWTEAAGSWAGSFKRTLGSIRGHLPSAKDFYVEDDFDEFERNEALKRQEQEGSGSLAQSQSPNKTEKSPSPRPHHPRKLLHVQDYSQGTPFGSQTSPTMHAPPNARHSSGVHGTSLGHHSVAPIAGAPAFNPNAGRNWNTGSWSLTSKEEIERARKPIPVTLRGRRDETQDVVHEKLASNLTAYLPRRLQLGKAWKLLYSSDQDGISLGTLYHKVEAGLTNGGHTRGPLSPSGGVADAEGWLRGASETTRAAVTGVQKVGSGLELKEAGLVVAIRDARDRVFGSFVNERLRAQPSYYGSGECFLWKQTDTGAIKTYKWTGRNDYMILSEAHYISFGGGEGRYGLWLDKRLEQGVSSPCPAFDNDILCDGRDEATRNEDKEGKFECIVLEVWACGID